MQPAGAMFRRMTGVQRPPVIPKGKHCSQFSLSRLKQSILHGAYHRAGRQSLDIPYGLAKIGGQLAQGFQSLATVAASVGAPPLVESVMKIVPVPAQVPGLEEQVIHVH